VIRGTPYGSAGRAIVRHVSDPHLHRSPYGRPDQESWQRPGTRGPAQPPQPGPHGGRPDGGRRPPPWTPPGSDTGPKRRNPLGLAALAISSVGAVLACLPVVRPVGWLLLPVGFVLGFFALFGTNRKLGAALSALGITLAGTSVAAVVGVLTVDNTFTVSFREGFVNGYSVTSGRGSPATAAIRDPAPTRSPEPAAGPGSRAQPFAIGRTLTFDEWDVTIESIDLDGTAAIMDSKYSVDPPDPGMRYALITASSTYRGDGSARAQHIHLDFVTDSGVVHSWSDKHVMLQNPRHGGTELYTGGTHMGHGVIQIPQDEGGLLRVSDMQGDPMYFVAPG
jgi:hypothetical protein